MNKEIKKYKAKVSYVLVLFVLLVFLIAFISILNERNFNSETIISLVIPFLFLAFILHLFFKTEYTIENGKLKIKCGLISYMPIEISQIKRISKTRSILSSPAPSFDRIKIEYGKFGEIIISPKDKVNFAKDLTTLNSNIENKITE